MKTQKKSLYWLFSFVIFLTLSCGSEQLDISTDEEEGGADAEGQNLTRIIPVGDQEEKAYNPVAGTGTSGYTGEKDTKPLGDTGGETFTAEHGSYSEDYVSDLSLLPNGKESAPDLTGVTFTPVTWKEYKSPYNITNQTDVKIKNLALGITWDSSRSYYGTSAIVVKGAETVTIENVSIKQMNSDFKAYHSIIIENCGTVIIRDSYFAGAVHSNHIRIRGAQKILIENTEIAGIDYTDNGVEDPVAGGGINIDNGQKGDTPDRELEWLVIQNNYIHDYHSNTGTSRNQDAFALMSPSDGILFNNYIENWKLGDSADAAIDIGHRRGDDPNYQNKLFRIERNIVINSTLNKFTGVDSANNTMMIVNNLEINAYTDDYHEGYTIFRLFNTSVYDDADVSIKGIYYKMSGTPSGKTYLGNNLIHGSDKLFKYAYYQSGNAQSDNFKKMLISDYQTFVSDMPTLSWLSGSKLPASGAIKTFPNWQDTSHDVNSSYQTTGSCFENASSGDYRLLSTCPAVNAACTTCGASYFSEGDPLLDHPGMRVTQDFLGTPRTTTASTGAFEPAVE